MQAAELSIEESFQVNSARDVAWRLLTDPSVVVRCMPGAEITEERDDGTLLGALRIKLGPTIVSFRGEVRPTFDESAKSGSLLAVGADGQGRTRARATTNFQVVPNDAGSLVKLMGRIEVSGPLAAFVRTGGAHLTRRLIAEFAVNLSAQIDASGESEPETADTSAVLVAVAAPSAKPVNAITLVVGLLADLLQTGLRRIRALGLRILGKKSRI